MNELHEYLLAMQSTSAGLAHHGFSHYPTVALSRCSDYCTSLCILLNSGGVQAVSNLLSMFADVEGKKKSKDENC